MAAPLIGLGGSVPDSCEAVEVHGDLVAADESAQVAERGVGNRGAADVGVAEDSVVGVVDRVVQHGVV